MFAVNRYLNDGTIIHVITTADEDEAMCAYFDEVRKLGEYRLTERKVKYSITHIILSQDANPVMELTRHYSA